ncbi:hypothetical protein DFP72DRAFT_1082930 [Ephemerocybe angulata]|uniref:Uncharacterized protein n=1 Tax=Ephemerocybe angulata TaxID=980116 RepID=A0A8H6H998_9AGAR|nr:hypothetical protein DFP72DRAFT_1082930 [Tulosesus angulatus]
MAPSGWANPVQKEFLLGFIAEYEECQVHRKLHRLLAEAVQQKLSELDEEQTALYSEKLKKLQQRLKEWYRWQLNPRSRNSASTISAKDIRSLYNCRTRHPKAYEAFAKLYPELTHEAHEVACDAEGLRGRKKIGKWHATCKRLLSEATPEQLSAVDALLESKKEEDEKGDNPLQDPATYQKFYDLLPGVLLAVVEPAVRKAGVLAFLTLIGPVPDHGGKILAKTFQYGEKPETPLLSSVWPNHESVYIEEIARFARKYEYTPEICAKRSLLPSQDASESQDESTPSSSNTSSPVGAKPIKEPASRDAHGPLADSALPNPTEVSTPIPGDSSTNKDTTKEKAEKAVLPETASNAANLSSKPSLPISSLLTLPSRPSPDVAQPLPTTLPSDVSTPQQRPHVAQSSNPVLQTGFSRCPILRLAPPSLGVRQEALGTHLVLLGPVSEF